MKTLWIVLAIVAALGLACCGGMFFLGKGVFNAVVDVNNEADLYSTKAFSAVAADWSYDVLQAEASPEFKEQIPAEQLRSLMGLYKEKLGAFKSVGEFSASNTQAKTNNGVSLVIVTTNATAQFEKGAGKVQLEVIKRDETWKLIAFSIESDALKK